jgi:Nucleotidyl transferase of unknown function (DUF2204)
MASRKSEWVSPAVQELLDLFLAAATETGKPYAIGGALAMGAHGYRRNTDDVDAFVQHKDRIEWMRALKKQGLVVSTLFAGVHYVARLPDEPDPNIRIDLLVPAEDPDTSAVEAPDLSMIADRQVEIWPIELLVITKFRSTREKDNADVAEMFELGLFDSEIVRSIMLHMNETSLARRFWKKYGGDK